MSQQRQDERVLDEPARRVPGGASRDRLLDVVGLLARLVLAGVLIVAGALKIGDPLGSARAVMAYEIFPWEISRVIGYALPITEIVLGVLLLIGIFTRAVAVVTALFWLAFIIGIASAWVRGLQIDCGCFGDGGALAAGEKPQYLGEIVRDIGLLLCSLWLIWRPRSLLSTDGALWGHRS